MMTSSGKTDVNAKYANVPMDDNTVSPNTGKARVENGLSRIKNVMRIYKPNGTEKTKRK
tara:strand:+ start:251 stop:427 length:177 start_codon:yes stop_codon:yes gene_type:complete